MRRVALVTGSSSGVGAAVARKLAARGIRVALVARSRDKLEEMVREIGAESAVAFATDLADRAAVRNLPARVVERFGGLDVLVNNAALNYRGAVATRAAEELAAIIDVNLIAPIVLTRAALDVMHAGGVVVNVASLAGIVALPGEATYSASKAGLRAFARALDMELEAAGIRVATVSPGPIDTPFIADVDNVPDLVFSQPMRTADEVADAVLACIERDVDEIALPAMSGALATLAYLFPRFATAVRPMLEKRGAANKQRYVEHKR